MEKTITFLRSLLRNKEDIIQTIGTDKYYLDTRIRNLEALVVEKDKQISKFTTNIDELAKLATNCSCYQPKKSDDQRKSEEITPKMTKKKEEKEKRDDKYVKNDTKTNKNVQWKKCKFEDEGQCKLRGKCPDFHPKKTCQFLGKLGSCPNRNKC